MGHIYTCRVHNNTLQSILYDKKFMNSLLDIKKISSCCNGCLFFGYHEINLLQNYNLESFLNFKLI